MVLRTEPLAELSPSAAPGKIVELDNPAVQSPYAARLTLIWPDQHVAWRADASRLPGVDTRRLCYVGD